MKKQQQYIMKIVVEPYSPQWGIAFEQLSEVYQEQLCGLLSGIEHIGSTSVWGLASKPVLDIDLIIDDASALPSITEKLEKLGYTGKGIVEIPERYVFTADSPFIPFTDPSKMWMKHNLYVCIKGSTALKNHISFRNYLRNNTEAAARYANLKYQLAASSESIGQYVSDKTEFISGALRQCGLSESELGEIRKVNMVSDNKSKE
ncbi:GrpB family protein [Flavobacterium olei]|uniref:GrpB family protein n=1 Tax=Flavobacterium olei TaxID=1886782 RepID=UPI00321ABF94